MEHVQPIATVSNRADQKSGVAIRKSLFSDAGTGNFFRNPMYHHAVLRALNHVAAHGANISEVLQATTHMRAGDEQNWYAEWTALGDRNVARARSVRNRQSRCGALLRAHTYYARAQFYLRRRYDLCRKVFYEGLETLGVAYEKIAVPYGRNELSAVYYPAPKPVNGPLIVFHGGYDPAEPILPEASRIKSLCPSWIFPRSRR
jgi:hypothetical protein